jgi:putative oxidoreductase
MLSHGLPKMNKFFSEAPISFPDPIGIGPKLSLILVVFAEVICSVLIAIGFATRFATIPLIITMIIAAFVVHLGDGFAKMELPVFYIIFYLILLKFGAGKYSIDGMIHKFRS